VTSEICQKSFEKFSIEFLKIKKKLIDASTFSDVLRVYIFTDSSIGDRSANDVVPSIIRTLNLLEFCHFRYTTRPSFCFTVMKLKINMKVTSVKQSISNPLHDSNCL
jgi:hypothetical protein